MTRMARGRRTAGTGERGWGSLACWGTGVSGAGVPAGGGCGEPVLPGARGRGGGAGGAAGGGAVAGGPGGGGAGRAGGRDPERRAAELWRRAARGDYGELLEERLGEVMAAGEVGRVRGLLGQLVGALAISLDEVMTGEADPQERSLAVSRLAHAATRVVATRRAEVGQIAAQTKAEERQEFWRFLAEMDAELDNWKKDGSGNEVNAAGRYGEEVDGGGGR